MTISCQKVEEWPHFYFFIHLEWLSVADALVKVSEISVGINWQLLENRVCIFVYFNVFKILLPIHLIFVKNLVVLFLKLNLTFSKIILFFKTMRKINREEEESYINSELVLSLFLYLFFIFNY
jgi:hypothetical protein